MTSDTLTPLQIATRHHREADMLIAGTYGNETPDGWRGCSVGCLAHEIGARRDDHAAVAAHYDYPEWLALLQDAVFEGLPQADRGGWHVDLADAIAARGRSWNVVLHAVHAAILRVSYRTAGSAAGAVQAVIDLHEAAVRGEPQDDAAWSAAESAAWSAARSAAYREIADAVLAEVSRGDPQ